jgi:hypothetical protein
MRDFVVDANWGHCTRARATRPSCSGRRRFRLGDAGPPTQVAAGPAIPLREPQTRNEGVAGSSPAVGSARVGVAREPAVGAGRAEVKWTAGCAQLDAGHASEPTPGPRLGLRNLARSLQDQGIIEGDSMQALGAFVASAEGLAVEACRAE